MANYSVVLFKNKKKKKIIKKFIDPKRAQDLYKKLISNSHEVIFEVKYESGIESNYELGIVHTSAKQDSPIYLTDDLGRFVKVKLEDEGMTLICISPYKKEEKIYDIKSNKKITIGEFIKKYLKGTNLKMVSTLNNKIVVQEDDEVSLFTLKSEEESARFVDCLSLYFYKTKRSDCLFNKDFSVPQKKYLYSFLESKGIDKKILYRKFTSLPQ